MPRRRRIMLSGPAFNELMSLVFLWPLLETDLPQTPPAIARADPSSSRRTRTVREGLVRALELLSVNTVKGASHSGRALTRSPRKKVSTYV